MGILSNVMKPNLVHKSIQCINYPITFIRLWNVDIQTVI